MITIISATNRKGSNTLKVSKAYQQIFEQLGSKASIFSLEDFKSMYRDEMFMAMEKSILIPSQKFVFIMPEYNGSFPGIFKLMIDNSDITACWNHKKVMLVGVANGRAGNLRGIDNMTNMCHYIKMEVMPNKLPISNISQEISEEGFISESTRQMVEQQIEQFIKF
ncbi:MAG: NAD(P)H-dependent oxidoreductase [Chitinophagaceae bacterium]